MIAEPIEFVGARNVAADLRGSHGVATIEQVRAWDPEIIVASNKDFAEKVRNDPEWASIAAVKSGHVYLSPKQPFGWVDYPPAVNRLIGLWWLAKIFYPDKFPEDIKTLARDFYTAFYHVTPSRRADRPRARRRRLSRAGKRWARGVSANHRRRARRRSRAPHGRRR